MSVVLYLNSTVLWAQNGHGDTYVFAKIYHNLDNQYIYNLIPNILSSCRPTYSLL